MLDRKIRTYTDYLKSVGETVVEIDGIPWMKYNNALVSATAMPVYVEISYEKAIKALNQTGALFLRYNTYVNDGDPILRNQSLRNQSEKYQNWWQVICRQYDIMSVSANTRSKIHRGLKRMMIRREDANWLANNGYNCHVKSYSRYKNVKAQPIKTFQYFTKTLAGLEFFDVWVCSNNNELLGYIICLREDNGVFMHTVDLTPAGLHDYAAYAMIHTILEHYVNKQGIPVSNGSRSISHETHMQDFLGKLGFQKEYSKLNVVYRHDIQLIIRILFPFRKLLRLFTALPVIHKVSAVLFQEEIIRQQSDSGV